MTESAVRESHFPQAQPSGPPISIPAAQAATEDHTLKSSRVVSGPRQPETQKAPADTTSDKATTAFIRRTLCAHNVLLGSGEKGRNLAATN